MGNSTKKKSDSFFFARRCTLLQKYASYLYTIIYLKVQRQKMGEKFQLKGGICEPSSDIMPKRWYMRTRVRI